MAYWWVSQGKTFRQERAGGYLWAPKKGSNDATFFHWSNMRLVQAGDIIFSYLDKTISAVAVARTSAYDAPRPSEILQPWHNDGLRVDADYNPVQPPLIISAFIDQFKALLPDRQSPITRSGTGVQGYLFALPPKAGRFLAGMLSSFVSVERLQEEAAENSGLEETTRKAIVDARLGHGTWRKKLLQNWSGQCAVTGLDVQALLRASHIKPWRDSNNLERLDERNGLLLSPAYDAAFDAGLISFQADGEIMISRSLTAERLQAAAISKTARLRSLSSAHLPYLVHHREVVFIWDAEPPNT